MNDKSFEITVRARFPQLFSTVKPLKNSTLKDLTQALDEDKNWCQESNTTQKQIARFLARYQSTDSYVLTTCRFFLEKKPRVGLHDTSPVLKGEILELVTYHSNKGLNTLKKHSLYRYFEGCVKEVGYKESI